MEQAATAEMIVDGLRGIGIEPSSHPRILACLSAGADSAFLTWALHEAGCEIVAFHLDHGLRSDSGRDAETARAIADQLEVPLRVVAVNLDISPGASPETAAREARYLIAEEVANEVDAEWIATGHTADDQIETFFINLARGAGLDGLAAIPPRRGRVIRPMLSVSRNAVRQACVSLGLEFVDDPTNTDRSILRNKIRHELLPQLDLVLGPGFRDAMLRQFRYLRGDAELLNSLADVELEGTTSLAGGMALAIDAEMLTRLEQALARRVIRRALVRLGVETPPAGRLVEHAVTAAKQGGSVDLGGGYIARKEGDYLVLRSRTMPVPRPSEGVLPGVIESPMLGIAVKGEIVQVPEQWRNEPGVAWISADAAGRFVLRTPVEGERFSPLGMKGSKPIADFLAESGMLRTAREWAPLLCRQPPGESGIAWVIGRRVGSNFAVPIGASKALRLTILPGKES